MTKKQLVLATSLFALAIMVAALLWTAGTARAAQPEQAPTITGVDPSSAPNDLDVVVTINGTDFMAVPTVTLGTSVLDQVGWLSSTALTATIPWGLDPGVYTVTVTNPGGESGMLSNAFTLTQGIGVWNGTRLYGGSVNEVAINPLIPETVYAVSHDVGMFRSEDGAETWTLQGAAGGEYSVRNLAIDPISPTVMYMYMPWDLHRSDDGGDTWTSLDAPGDIPFPHPTDSGTLFVSNPGEGESGLWKSTDYGQTWLTVTTGLTDTRVNNLVFDPTNPLTIYVGTELGNIFVSPDGGASWSFVDQPVDLVQKLAINPQGGHELWVSSCCFCQPQATLKSTNASHTAWTPVGAPVDSVSLKSIEFAPNAWGPAYADTVFVSDCWDEIQRSDDGGDSWSSLDPQDDEWHSGLALHPGDPSVLYATGNHEAIYKTMDSGTTWQVTHEGLTAVVPEQMSTVPNQPDILYAVTDIGLLKGIGGGATWQNLPVGGDVKFVASAPNVPGRVYAAGGDVGKGQDLPVYISHDGGQTWPVTVYMPEPAQYDQHAHLNPIIQPDPTQPGVLLAGVRHALIEQDGDEAGSLYHRNEDAGLFLAEVDVGQPISPVQDIAFDAVEPTVVYLATSGEWHDDGTGLFRSTDGGLTWEPIGTGIAVEPRHPYRVFVLANGRVYVSGDLGLTWTQTNISHGAIECLLSSHDSPNSILYLATGMGLYHSTDGGDSWERASGVLGQVPVYSLAEAVTADRTVLYAGTTGGYVTTGGYQPLSQPLADATLVNAGVYRFTTRQGWKVYLPLVLRDSQ
jgi:photosystem II stability/assembly factor-like uncharacterized protein